MGPLIITDDLHVHTSLCHHAIGEMEEYVQSAIQTGLKRLAFLEHLELGIQWKKELWLSEADFDVYFREGEQLQKKYSEQLEILIGVECGWNREEKENLRQKLLERNWQEIGISCHYLKIPGRSLHLNLFSRNEEDIAFIREYGVEKIFSLYLDNLIEAVQYLPGNKLCHLDGALRHINWTLTEEHYQQIEILLSQIKTQGMTLEINTSGFRLRGEQFPSKTILKMAERYKLKLAPGSDAHCPEDVGRDFDRILPFFRNQ